MKTKGRKFEVIVPMNAVTPDDGEHDIQKALEMGGIDVSMVKSEGVVDLEFEEE
jgi:hypothetical protein